MNQQGCCIGEVPNVRHDVDEMQSGRRAGGLSRRRAHLHANVADALDVGERRQRIDDFDKASKKSRRLQLRTLRAAVEQGDEEIQTVLHEVLNLPKKELADLTALLRETSLSAIIGGARVVSDRLKVLTGLEALVFKDDFRKTQRERTQLHQLVAENTWLFGDEFHLMADDEGLTRCLAEHAKARGIQVL